MGWAELDRPEVLVVHRRMPSGERWQPYHSTHHTVAHQADKHIYFLIWRRTPSQQELLDNVPLSPIPGGGWKRMNPDGGNSNYNSFGLKNALSFGTPISLFKKRPDGIRMKNPTLCIIQILRMHNYKLKTKYPSNYGRGGSKYVR